MTLISAYKSVKDSIVAFTMKYIPVVKEGEPPPLFPPIFGTGFVIREDGLIATNAHVAEVFKQLPTPWPVRGLLFKFVNRRMHQIPLEIIKVSDSLEFIAGENYYGPKEGPDLAFVQVRAKGLSTVEIDGDMFIEEGMEVATAGFPLGEITLIAPGYFHQATPTLQRGIVSAVLPFSCKTPHSFMVNIMAQPGSSGSPVFSCENGKVLGVLYAGLKGLTEGFWTNLSYVVPSYYIANLLRSLNDDDLRLPEDTPTIDELITLSSKRDLAKEGFGWKIMEVNPETENKRIKRARFDAD